MRKGEKVFLNVLTGELKKTKLSSLCTMRMRACLGEYGCGNGVRVTAKQ